MKKAVIKMSYKLSIFPFISRPYYWFILVGDNGEIVATSETYTQKHNAVEVLNKYFPEFPIGTEKMLP